MRNWLPIQSCDAVSLHRHEKVMGHPKGGDSRGNNYQQRSAFHAVLIILFRLKCALQLLNGGRTHSRRSHRRATPARRNHTGASRSSGACRGTATAAAGAARRLPERRNRRHGCARTGVSLSSLLIQLIGVLQPARAFLHVRQRHQSVPVCNPRANEIPRRHDEVSLRDRFLRVSIHIRRSVKLPLEGRTGTVVRPWVKGVALRVWLIAIVKCFLCGGPSHQHSSVRPLHHGTLEGVIVPVHLGRSKRPYTGTNPAPLGKRVGGPPSRTTPLAGPSCVRTPCRYYQQ